MKVWTQALVLALTAAQSVGAPAGAEPRQPELLARSGKWVLNVDTDSCQLIAQFGEGTDTVIAKFTRFEPAEQFDLALLGTRMRASKPYGEARLDFGLKGEPVEVSGMNGSLGGWEASFFRNVRLDGWRSQKEGEVSPRITPQQEAAVTGLTVAIKGRPPFRLDFGSLDKPFAQLRGCAVNLLHHWGYDYQVQSRLLRPAAPISSPRDWLRNDDYPGSAMVTGDSGFVRFRLDVDAEGKVTGCHILDRTSVKAFADVACDVIAKRARMQAALDEKGVPVRSFWIMSARFELPQPQ